MKIGIGGTILIVLGILGACFWHLDVFIVLKGIFPILFILCGGLLLYLGYGEIKEIITQRKTNKKASAEKVDQYRQEIENLKKEIERLQQKEVQEGIPSWMSKDIDLKDSDESISKSVS